MNKDKPKTRPSPDAASPRGRPARKSTNAPPVRSDDDDIVLETYEQSPERPGDDERTDRPPPE